jgi:hypothetical protein
LECSKLGGQWKVKEKHLFTSSIFPQQTCLHPQFFPFGLTFFLYHGPKPLLTPFFLFLRSINYDCAPQRNKSFTPSLSIWFWLKIWPFFLSLKLWRHAWSHLTGRKPHKQMKNRLRSHLYILP